MTALDWWQPRLLVHLHWVLVPLLLSWAPASWATCRRFESNLNANLNFKLVKVQNEVQRPVMQTTAWNCGMEVECVVDACVGVRGSDV